MLTLSDYLATNPPDRERFERRCTVCPRHQLPTVTVMGYVSQMDVSPAGDFIEDAMQNPCCLGVGEHLAPHPSRRPQRLVYCPACEEGMAALQAARSAERSAQPSRKAARRQARLERRRSGKKRQR